MLRVLKINQSYEPIDIISWKNAIRLIFLEKVEVIKEYDRFIKTPNSLYKLPAVVRLFGSFKRPRKRIRFNRRNIIRRDRNCCQYCGNVFPPTKLTLDHVIPRALGGKTEWENIVCACSICNAKKSNKLLHDVGMKLKKKPVKPDWMPSEILSLYNKKIPNEWRDFCYVG